MTLLAMCRRLRIFRVIAPLGLLVGLLVSCIQVHPPTPVSPPVALPAEFAPGLGEAAMPAAWWTAFGDAQLTGMIDQALRQNFSLRAAWDRLDQARALAVKSGAALQPSLTGTGEASRTVRDNEGQDRVYTNRFGLGLTASYEWDLWGRLHSSRDAAALDVVASAQDLRTAGLTLAAEIASTWFQLIEQQGQRELLDRQYETNSKYLEVITMKFRRGQVTATDVLQQRQVVEETNGQRILVDSSLQLLRNQLAVLVGTVPGAANLPSSPLSLPALPPTPGAAPPLEQLGQRPDVQAAVASLQAADRRLAVAVANRLPQLSLSLHAESSAEKSRDLFDNWLGNLAANLTAPLLDGGVRRAEVELNRAQTAEKLNLYGATLLGAYQNVVDALVKEQRQGDYLASLQRQGELSAQAAERIMINYSKGSMDFSRYLTALVSHQRLQRTLLQARRDLILRRVELYRALGGPWSPAPPVPEAAKTET